MGYNDTNPWRERIVGLDERLPLFDGRLAPYVHLDNAASTPALREVVEAVASLLPCYSSVHRGAGFKSRVSTAAYEDAHEAIASFVGADARSNTVIFGKNTTEAINKLAFRYPLTPESVVLSTAMEHHSNDLPWRHRCHLVRARVTREGRVDEADLDRLLDIYGSRVALVTVSGASNVTGFVQPVHRLARKAHAVGARILVDAAQLAPHRRIDMKANDDPEHLDFVALSAHKMYAPFGTGALVGRRDVFKQGAPEYRGGGTVDIVTPAHVAWADLPDREEAGTPNVVGAVAMATAAQALAGADMDALVRHEAQVTGYALRRLGAIPGVTLYGERDLLPGRDRVGVIPFTVAGIDHALVAAILGYEGGIGVRNGCFCAQGYVSHLLGQTEEDQARRYQRYIDGDKSGRPGMVRISFGAYNTLDEVDSAVEIVEQVARGVWRGRYLLLPNGDYVPAGYDDPVRRHFAVGLHSKLLHAEAVAH